MSDMLIVDDPFAPELRMHPSDWDRGADGRDKLRERREEIIRAFDSAMARFGQDREFVADRLAYIAASVLSAGVGLGLNMDTTMRLEVVRNADDDADEPDAPTLREEAAAVLVQLDELAVIWGDEGVFRRCRDRLRTAIERSDA